MTTWVFFLLYQIVNTTNNMLCETIHYNIRCKRTINTSLELLVRIIKNHILDFLWLFSFNSASLSDKMMLSIWLDLIVFSHFMSIEWTLITTTKYNPCNYCPQVRVFPTNGGLAKVVGKIHTIRHSFWESECMYEMWCLNITYKP
jgi:hypothetical protein